MKLGKKYERSTRGLHEMLFDSIEAVQGGSMKASEAVQLSSVVRQIVATADLELRVQRQSKDMGVDVDALVLAPPIVSLGHDAGESDTVQ